MLHDQAFEALANPTRRQILELLHAQGPQHVAALAQRFEVSRPAISRHLKLLAESGLVVHEAQGKHNIYALRMEGLAPLRAYLDVFWSDALARLKLLAENTPPRTPDLK